MNNSNALSSISTDQDWPHDAAPKSWIESLFQRMSMEHGKEFSDLWGAVSAAEMKKHWGKRLAKLTAEEWKRGVNSLDTRNSPPSLPEFVKLCKPSIDPTVAYYQAVNGMQARERGENGEWAHPAIFWAAVTISAFDLKNMPYTQLRSRWEAALQSEMEKGSWGDIPAPMLALTASSRGPLSREKADQILRSLKAEDVAKDGQERFDHKRWAKRIMERVRSGDKTVTGIQKKFAAEALSARDE